MQRIAVHCNKINLKTLFLLLAVGFGQVVYSQCYVKSGGGENQNTQVQEIKFPSKTELEQFFKVNSTIYELLQQDSFCLNNAEGSQMLKIYLGGTFLSDLNNSGELLDPYLAKLFSNRLYADYDSQLTQSEFDKITDALAGYYVCYRYITLNWEALYANVSELKEASDFLNQVMENYAQVRAQYSISGTNAGKRTLREIKKDFLNGSYYAMPPDFRMHVETTQEFGNDLAQLIPKLMAQPQFSDFELINMPLVFVIQKSTN